MIPQGLKSKCREYIEGLLQRKIIRKSESLWRSHIRCVAKPDGGVRVVSNLICLNTHLIKDPYQIADIKEVIRATSFLKWFSVIDLKEAYYSI